MEITQDIYFDVAKHAKAWGVAHEKASEIIQKELFKAGREWHWGGCNPRHTEENYLFAYSDNMDIRYSDTLSFQGCPQAEATLQASTTYTLLIAEQEELVEFAGKKYSKADIEKALSLLKPKEEA